MALPGVSTSLSDGNLGLTGSTAIDNVFMFVSEAQDGSISTITETIDGASSATLSASGNPTADMDIHIKVTGAGDLGAAKYKVSYDGGDNWSEEYTVPADGEVSLDDNVDLTFGGSAYVVDDLWEFTTERGAPINTPILVNKNNYKSLFRSGNLVDYFDEYFATKVDGKNPALAYGIRPENDQSGSIGSVTFDRTGDGDFSTSGTPKKDMDVIVKIVQTEGDCETAKYQYTTDGGDSWSDVYTTPASTTAAYIGGGVSITFTDGTTPSFKVGDKFSFTVTSPYADDVMDAISSDLSTLRDAVKYLGQFSAFVIGQENSYDNWVSMTTLLNDLESVGFYAWALMFSENKSSTISAWVTTLTNEAETFFDKRIAVTPELVTGLQHSDINQGTMLAAKYATTPVNRDAGRVKDGAINTIASVNDFDDIRPYRTQLDNANFSILIDYPGLDGYYFANSNLMSSSTSDYKYIRDIRTANKVRRLASQSATNMLKDDVEAIPGVLESIGATIKDAVESAMVGEITSLEVEVTSTLSDLSSTGKITLELRIDRRLVIDNFEIGVGYTAPTSA